LAKLGVDFRTCLALRFV